jgi:hypothetical protein
MATASDVLTMLIPSGGWAVQNNDFDSIFYDEGVTPLTKKQFDDGFAAYDALHAAQEKSKAEKKAALLERLGITADEAALLVQ